MRRACPGVFPDPGDDAMFSPSPVLRRALFLDRDGVINVDHGYVHRPQDTEFLGGIFALCRQAIAAGLLPIVVTNQAGIARGLYDEPQFLDYTRWVHDEFASRGAPLVATYYCPHHVDAALDKYRLDCECRKPRPGMLLRAQSDLGIDLPRSLLIGDKHSDLGAGRAAGVGHLLKIGGRDLAPATDWLQHAMNAEPSNA